MTEATQIEHTETPVSEDEHPVSAATTDSHVEATEEQAETHAESESTIHVSLKPDTLFTVGNFPITNSLWVSYFLTIVLSLTLYLSQNA
jgi:CO dehydrogenase/acetyl-CoA synthase beta subunit